MEFLSNQSYSDLNNIQDNTPNLYYQYIITPVRVKNVHLVVLKRYQYNYLRLYQYVV
jgi:hypothetical protein